MAAIELSGVTKAWGDSVAVRDLSFTVEAGTFVVLLGPSSCGKSTTLRMIAGLEDTSQGRVMIAGDDVTYAPPAARRVSMVFQSYALFPHLDVRQNILFGLQVRKVPAAEQDRRLDRVAAMVGLSALLDRKPSQLSGGQRQRVALARAVVAENPICLMDEPLSNLDARLRHDMRVELRALQQRLGMTVVYVTHDQTEAMSMADKVVLLRDGEMEQEGAPDRLYDAPATTFVVNFIGTPPMNMIRLARGDGDLVVDGSAGPPVIDGDGRDLILGVRPEHVEFGDDTGVEGRVDSCDYLGADTIVAVTIGSQPVMVRTSGRFAPTPGTAVRLRWSVADAHVFDAADGRRVAAAPLPAAAQG